VENGKVSPGKELEANSCCIGTAFGKNPGNDFCSCARYIPSVLLQFFNMLRNDVSIGTLVLGQTKGGNPRTCLGDARTGELSPTLLKAAVDENNHSV
jgi:hypothetical protein